MDPFRKLPGQVQLRLLESFSSFEEANAASHASARLLRRFKEFRVRIGSVYIKRYHLDDALIQDAVAIMSFPRAPDHLNKREHYSSVCAHLRLWGEKGLRNPTKPAMFNKRLIVELERLCRWIWIYADDYLSKATSEYLPRAYQRIPEWSPASWTQRQEGIRRKARITDGVSLTMEQKRQIVKAFLRYELLCRIYGPQGNDDDFLMGDHHSLNMSDYCCTLPGPDHAGAKAIKPRELFKFWDWAILNRFEGADINSPDLQLLPCVREYIQTLYHALVAEHLQLRLPKPRKPRPDYENAPSKGACSPFECLRLTSMNSKSFKISKYNEAISLAVSAGLDLLTDVLMSGIKGKDETFDEIINDMRFSYLHTNATNVSGSIRDPVATQGVSYFPDTFTRLNRQRAWPLFKEAGVGPELPSKTEYRQVYGPWTRMGRDTWGGESNGRGELICHGAGIWTCPMAGEVRGERFWKIAMP